MTRPLPRGYMDLDDALPPGNAESNFDKTKEKDSVVQLNPDGVQWSPEQRGALDKVTAWLKAAHMGGPQVFRLFGYAGTGKSTLAKSIGDIERTRHGGYPQFCAFTGKAAVVMRRKGCDNARTIHGLIYSSHDKSENELRKLELSLARAQRVNSPDIAALETAIRLERENLKQPGFALKPNALQLWEVDEGGERTTGEKVTMFIVDECSMVDTALGSDLLSFGAPTLVLGDPAQLPPVMAGAGYFTNCIHPDVLLTQIHRQAEGNPIIAMASKVRNGIHLGLGTYGESRVVKTSELAAADWLAADQILVGKNATRHGINRRCRVLLGHEGFLPRPGEKLVCTRNNHEAGLLNGSLWECIESEDKPKDFLFWLTAKSLDGDERTIHVPVHKAVFIGEEIPDPWTRKRGNEFEFGYALTVHKSQGSQWDSVILMDEWLQRNRAEWLYTGITRAAERVTVVRR